MASQSDYVSGQISLSNGSVDFAGSGTGWLLAGFRDGDTIIDITGATEFMGVIASIDANGAGKLTKPWEGPDLVDAAYRMRYQGDGSRVAAQARNLIELLGNGTLLSMAGLEGPGVIELLAGGGAQVVPKTDLVSGANYDVQVDSLAARAAYDGQAEGFSVLVANVGDGRAAIYSKITSASAVWTAPAYVTGPGSTVPGPAGVTVQGIYNPATAYAVRDAVLDNGSSWIALQATTGHAPPVLPATSNAYWQLLARKGTDGAGTGDMVGPTVALDKRLVVFDGTTGKLTAQAGGLTATQKLQARTDIGLNVGIGATLDLRGTVYETGVPSDLYNAGTYFGIARGGTDGLNIGGLPTGHIGVLRSHGQWTDGTALGALQREFSSPLGTWRQYAASASVWGAWIRTSGLWEQIGEPVVIGSTVGSYTFSGLSAYRLLRLRGVFISTVSNSLCLARIGATTPDAATSYRNQRVVGEGVAVITDYAAQTWMSLTGSVAVAGMSDVSLDLFNFNKATPTRFRAESSGLTTGASDYWVSVRGLHAPSTACDVLLVGSNTGGLGAGSYFTLEGVRG